MKHWVFVVLAAAVLTACDPAPPGQEEAVGDSPIASFDKDRLWLLLKASRVGDGRQCGDFYRAPDDVRYRGLADSCEAWTLNFADYLKLNGLPSVEAAHLRELVYWEWFETTRQSILDCQTQYVDQSFMNRPEAERLQRNTSRNACDPFDNARKNNKQTPEDLGIRHN